MSALDALDLRFTQIQKYIVQLQSILTDSNKKNESTQETITDSKWTPATQRIIKYCKQNRLYSTRFMQVSQDYYDHPLEARRAQLDAPSVHHLCKSMIIENTQCKSSDLSNRLNSRFYFIVLQYTTKIDSDKIMKMLREMNAGKMSKSEISISLADKGLSEEMTGFTRNAITPFASNTKIPVILSDEITRLEPAYFWLGGGEIDVKMEISVQEFIKHLDPIIGDITESK